MSPPDLNRKMTRYGEALLFIDSETDRPSVVYRRKGWDYGVIGLDENAVELQEVATATRKMRG